MAVFSIYFILFYYKVHACCKKKKKKGQEIHKHQIVPCSPTTVIPFGVLSSQTWFLMDGYMTD